MKYSKGGHVVSWTGGRANLRVGQSIADNHPLALERPDLFTDEAPEAELQAPPRVETNLQRPGENRAERGGPRIGDVKRAPRG